MSIVADMMISLRREDFCSCCFRTASSTSVLMLLSCASSSINTWYLRPTISSRMAIPSVTKWITVFSDRCYSNRTLYPTSWPMSQLSSIATRFARVIALILLGCDTQIELKPAPRRYCGTCVVFPLPVSPVITTTWLFLTSSTICCLYRVIGSWSLPGSLVTTAFVSVLYFVFFVVGGSLGRAAYSFRRWPFIW